MKISIKDTLVGCEVMLLIIMQLSPKPRMSERRSSTICAIVERSDHRCGDDFVYLFYFILYMYILVIYVYFFSQVLDPRVLPNYGFRDDGMLLYKAIEQYVSKIVRHYYGECINQSIHQSIKTRDAQASLGYPDRCLRCDGCPSTPVLCNAEQ